MSLGATRTRTFFEVLLPLSLHGIAGGFILVFSIAISAYATPAILGAVHPATGIRARRVPLLPHRLRDAIVAQGIGAQGKGP